MVDPDSSGMTDPFYLREDTSTVEHDVKLESR